MDQPPAKAGLPAAPELTGDDAYLIGETSGLHAHSGFTGALRGYDRHQVDRYVTRTQRHIDELTAELTVMTRRERVLTSRVDELAEAVARCTCGPDTPPSAIIGGRLRQILDLALEEAAEARTSAEADAQVLREEAANNLERAEADARALREEAANDLEQARAQVERATAECEADLQRRRDAEDAAEKERRAAMDNWAQQRVGEARETARRLIENAAQVSGQVVASARWLVDALGAHRDALSEQLGGVSRRIEALPSLEPAAAIAAVDNPDGTRHPDRSEDAGGPERPDGPGNTPGTQRPERGGRPDGGGRPEATPPPDGGGRPVRAVAKVAVARGSDAPTGDAVQPADSVSAHRPP
jgi:hypothetical protein